MQPPMFNIGDKLFLRTVTYHLVGEVERIEGDCGREAVMTSLPRESNSPLLERGTRRVHLNSGEVWRSAGPAGSRPDVLCIVREHDGERRTVAVHYWLGESWGTPRTREGARNP